MNGNACDFKVAPFDDLKSLFQQEAFGKFAGLAIHLAKVVGGGLGFDRVIQGGDDAGPGDVRIGIKKMDVTIRFEITKCDDCVVWRDGHKARASIVHQFGQSVRIRGKLCPDGDLFRVIAKLAKCGHSTKINRRHLWRVTIFELANGRHSCGPHAVSKKATSSDVARRK